MVEQGWGRMINISGLAARQAASAFGSIRNAAVAALTKNLADELGPAGINVTTDRDQPPRPRRPASAPAQCRLSAGRTAA